jgi:hypothetical protein
VVDPRTAIFYVPFQSDPSPNRTKMAKPGIRRFGEPTNRPSTAHSFCGRIRLMRSTPTLTRSPSRWPIRSLRVARTPEPSCFVPWPVNADRQPCCYEQQRHREGNRDSARGRLPLEDTQVQVQHLLQSHECITPYCLMPLLISCDPPIVV